MLFQIPSPDTENPLECLDGPEIADGFTVVNDLGALDVIRAHDHGMPTYNDMREAYGLARVTSFAELTGEETEEIPHDDMIDSTDPINDPSILDFVLLVDDEGNVLEQGTAAADGETVTAIRRTSTAARLKAIFGSIDDVDAFTGMVCEAHVVGTEFGELQLAMWTSQFEALRDGDRFFYANDPVLEQIADVYGIDYRQTLAEVIVANTEVDSADLAANLFLVSDAETDDEDGDISGDGGADSDVTSRRRHPGRRGEPGRSRVRR